MVILEKLWLPTFEIFAGEQSQNYLVMVTACISVGKIFESDVYRITGVQFLPLRQPLPRGVQLIGDERVLEVKNYDYIRN